MQTPLRISFFGGGTDFPDYFRSQGGSVLSSSINKYVSIVVKKRFDDKVRVGYTRIETVSRVEDLEHELIREALKMTGVSHGVEIITLGDIPAGTGLGSSSAVTVGTLHALYTLQGIPVTSERLAREACEIEVDILKKPIGYQDQYIAALGGLRFFEFHKDGTVQFDEVELDQQILKELSDRLLLFFTGTTRKAENILGEQKDNIQNNLHTLGILKEMASVAREDLIKGRFDTFGLLLSESWELKKGLATGISNGDLEDIFLKARKAGAIGGKITGAGGGGFLMLFCAPDKKNSVRASLAHLRELPFRLEATGSKVILNQVDE